MAPPDGHGDAGAASTSGVAYNVYSQPIDPNNQMPVTPNQLPWPGQHKALSTERAVSNIPKGGTAGRATWVFPSSQMFFNALQRKGKADDVLEEDMEHVISVHNSMNEMTWQQVLRWEHLHREKCAMPSLLRFLGRPEDTSPRARWRSLMGGALPFDRHDWYVDRNGKQVRYVIDFYFDERRAGSPDAFVVDARPALDDLGSLQDRAKMGVYVWCLRLGLPCPFSAAPTLLEKKT